MDAPLLNIGASKDTVQEARKAILDILATTNEQKTKRYALGVLARLCAVDGTTVTNCTFTADGALQDDEPYDPPDLDI